MFSDVFMSDSSRLAILLLIDITTIALLFSTSAIQSKYTIFQNTLYIVDSPLAGLIIFFHSYHQFLMLRDCHHPCDPFTARIILNAY